MNHKLEINIARSLVFVLSFSMYMYQSLFPSFPSLCIIPCFHPFLLYASSLVSILSFSLTHLLSPDHRASYCAPRRSTFRLVSFLSLSEDEEIDDEIMLDKETISSVSCRIIT